MTGPQLAMVLPTKPSPWLAFNRPAATSAKMHIKKLCSDVLQVGK